MTIDELYEAYMDEGRFADDPKSFAQDIYKFMDFRFEGTDWTPEVWEKEYGMYLPTYDYGAIDIAKRERDVDYDHAMKALKLTQETTDRVYDTELDTLSTALGREMKKGRQVAGASGLRTGALEGAVEDTVAIAGGKAKDLGDRLSITGQEIKDKYNVTMVDTALDFDKAERDEKRELYDRTMAAIMRLEGMGAFADMPEKTEDPEAVLLQGQGCPEELLQADAGHFNHEVLDAEGNVTSITCKNPDDTAWTSGVYYEHGSTDDCKCFVDVGGATECFPEGCDPSWSQEETFCDQHNDDCNDPKSCKYPCGDDTGDVIPSDFSISDGECVGPIYEECSLWDDMWGNCDYTPTCWRDFVEVSCDSC